MVDLITQFERSTRFQAMIAPCQDDYGLGGASDYEWPNNVLSSRTVIYESGVIAREGDAVVHRVDPEELARCERIADAAAEVMQGEVVGMGSEGGEPFAPWYRVANVGDVPVAEVDEAFVRALFGGTICPLDAMIVEPLREGGAFWESAVTEQMGADTMARWKALVSFFADHPELSRPTFASIGFADYAPAKRLDRASLPDGFESRGCCMPRVAFGLTAAGSAVGLFGHVVWT